jgi:hypothetical protein
MVIFRAAEKVFQRRHILTLMPAPLRIDRAVDLRGGLGSLRIIPRGQLD